MGDAINDPLNDRWRLLRTRAGMVVAVGWLLFVVSIPFCLVMRAHAGINLFYFPSYEWASLDAFDLEAYAFAMAAGAVATVVSSIALALKFRVVASALVVAIWGSLILGIPAARLFVPPGPKSYERHIDDKLFLVPWRYGPESPGFAGNSSGEIGFSVRLCLSSLKGQHDDDCAREQRARQLRIVPKDWISSEFDIGIWRKFGSRMSAGPERDGYKSYAHSYPAPAGAASDVHHYFVRQNSEGQLTRLVVCRQDSEDSCSHYALAGYYWLNYHAPLTAGDALDGKLAALIESWRAN